MTDMRGDQTKKRPGSREHTLSCTPASIDAELLDADALVSRHERFANADQLLEEVVREHLLRLRLEYNGGEPFPGALRTYGTENVLDVLKDGRYVCMETVSGCRLCGELLDPAYWAAQWVSRQHGGWQQREHEHYHSVCALAQRNKA